MAYIYQKRQLFSQMSVVLNREALESRQWRWFHHFPESFLFLLSKQLTDDYDDKYWKWCTTSIQSTSILLYSN